MKKQLFFVFAVSLVGLWSCSSEFKGPKAPDQPYGEKSGIIKYKPMEMGGVKAIQTLYFDDYGKKELRETEVVNTAAGAAKTQHSIDFRDGKVAYHWEVRDAADTSGRAVYKQTMPDDMFDQMNVNNLKEKLKKEMSFKDEGTEKVAGFKCKKYSISPPGVHSQGPITAAHYKNVPMKLSLGNMQIEAEKAEFNVSIPAEKFVIPAGYQVIDIDQMQHTQPMPPADSAATK